MRARDTTNRRGIRWALCALTLAIGLFSTGPVRAQDEPARHALVIGTGLYEAASALPNASANAQEIAARLASLGYVIHGGEALIDPTRAMLQAAFFAFARAVPEHSVALVYVAGHGLSDGAMSFVLGRDDGAIRTRADLPVRAAPLRWLSERLAARRDVEAIILVDTCRTNPLPGPTSGAGSDLVAPEGGALRIVLAAAPGQIAQEASPLDPAHSPFAAALLGALDTPALMPDALIRQMTLETSRLSHGAQQVASSAVLSRARDLPLTPLSSCPAQESTEQCSMRRHP